jgi:predicted transcriptional regulator
MNYSGPWPGKSGKPPPACLRKNALHWNPLSPIEATRELCPGRSGTKRRANAGKNPAEAGLNAGASNLSWLTFTFEISVQLSQYLRLHYPELILRQINMNSFERRNKIVDLVNAQGSVLVIDLSNTFGISEVTIRADLRLLEEKGLVTRFHGGAAKPGTHMMESDNQEVTLEDRYKLASDPKKRIAQAAAAMIEEGMTLFWIAEVPQCSSPKRWRKSQHHRHHQQPSCCVCPL